MQGQLFAQVIDFYLREENLHHWETIKNLAQHESEMSEQQLRMYVLEAARICSSVALPRKVNSDVTIPDGAETHHFKAGDLLVVNLVQCGNDPARFPHPDRIDVARSEHDYIFYGWGPHQCLGMDASKVALTTMLRTVARLEGLRRAPGPMGHLKTLKTPQGFSQYLMPDGSALFPFPTTMKLRWDGKLPTPIEDTPEEEL